MRFRFITHNPLLEVRSVASLIVGYFEDTPVE